MTALSSVQQQPTIVTERYGRTIDLSAFEPDHRAAIEEAINNAEGAAILAEPLRYVPDGGEPGQRRTLVALREWHAGSGGIDHWYVALDVATGSCWSGDTVIGAMRAARGMDAR